MDKLNLGIEELHIVKNSKVKDFVKGDDFQHAFFSKIISEDGLIDFHVTIESGLDDEQKRAIIQEMIDTWDEPQDWGEPSASKEITNL